MIYFCNLKAVRIKNGKTKEQNGEGHVIILGHVIGTLCNENCDNCRLNQYFLLDINSVTLYLLSYFPATKYFVNNFEDLKVIFILF